MCRQRRLPLCLLPLLLCCCAAAGYEKIRVEEAPETGLGWLDGVEVQATLLYTVYGTQYVSKYLLRRNKLNCDRQHAATLSSDWLLNPLLLSNLKRNFNQSKPPDEWVMVGRDSPSRAWIARWRPADATLKLNFARDLEPFNETTTFAALCLKPLRRLQQPNRMRHFARVAGFAACGAACALLICILLFFCLAFRRLRQLQTLLRPPACSWASTRYGNQSMGSIDARLEYERRKLQGF